MIRFITHISLNLFLICSSLLAQIKTEEILINNYEIQLPGTLTYSKVKTPLLIWVHGSGNIDRNGNQAGVQIGANYILQAREALHTKGFAFFSYDKRTSNPKNMAFMKENGILFGDFVDDLKEVISHFERDGRFSEVILLGHSQGSLIAMLASDKADKIISIAGPSETIDKTIIRQVSSQSEELGFLCTKYFKELEETGEIQQVDPRLLSLFAKPNQPFFKSWLLFDPIKTIKTITIPILIINGSKDIQVGIENAIKLKEANPKADLTIIENMNHVLKEITKDEDNLKSYQTSKYPISKTLIERIEGFLKK